MTTRRNHTHDVKQAASQAAQLVTRQTCEGCAFLRIHPRPMCLSETSPNWRTPRDTYQDRCNAYAVKGRQQPKQNVTSVPRPPETKRKRSYVTGDVSRRLS
jgi:hypothetical protein